MPLTDQYIKQYAQHNLASCVLKLRGATEEAEKLAQKAANGLPLQAGFWYNLANIYAGRGKETEARYAFAQVIKLAPGTELAESAKEILGA